jgi:hypothetical protein
MCGRVGDEVVVLNGSLGSDASRLSVRRRMGDFAECDWGAREKQGDGTS